MSIFRNNRPTRDFPGAAQQREIAQRRLEEKMANNRAIADAHRRATGPDVSHSQEAQPALQRPRINIP